MHEKTLTDSPVSLFGHQERTMRIAIFSSCGPGNFVAAVNAGHASAGRFSVCLLVTDRPGIPAIDAADREGIPVITSDFPCALNGATSDRKRELADLLHDSVLHQIKSFEAASGAIDICVLAYRRVIRGQLLRTGASTTVVEPVRFW